jgi:2-amino-4-hydroxy-6-hydroxymethyldihydropteridine diphosphokinase
MKTYLGMGTNLGDPLQQMSRALTSLHHTEGMRVTSLSSIYQTSPIGYLDQPDFYNMVIEMETLLTPTQLLAAILQIEKKLHRVRTMRWGPRTIDIDILLYGDHLIQSKELQIPHPRMKERAFVLIPLYELIGNKILPGTEQTLREWIEQLPPGQGIQMLTVTTQAPFE